VGGQFNKLENNFLPAASCQTIFQFGAQSRIWKKLGSKVISNPISILNSQLLPSTQRWKVKCQWEVGKVEKRNLVFGRIKGESVGNWLISIILLSLYKLQRTKRQITGKTWPKSFVSSSCFLSPHCPWFVDFYWHREIMFGESCRRVLSGMWPQSSFPGQVVSETCKKRFRSKSRRISYHPSVVSWGCGNSVNWGELNQKFNCSRKGSLRVKVFL
jgi:hypothetical protein